MSGSLSYIDKYNGLDVYRNSAGSEYYFKKVAANNENKEK